ncbi:MAG: homoserine dehydrogenase [Acidimicrobiales bacterium]
MQSHPARKAVRVAVLGAGNVGGALCRMLLEDADGIEERTGVRLELVGVAVADLTRDRPGIPSLLITGDAKNLASDPNVDVVVELIGGTDTARVAVEAALSGGKPVVTANKEMIAASGAELAGTADRAGVDLLYEAAVAGAIPLVRALRDSLAGETVWRVMGIVNGTTNFILTTMAEEGVAYEEALSEAQRLGLAERDPTADVEGFDAAAKVAILASIAFGCDFSPDDVHREGIVGLRGVDVAFAERLGYVVKLLAVAERVPTDDPVPDVSVRVHPALVPRAHPLASVRGSFNAVFVEGESCGDLMLYGRGAGGRPTASAVLGDLIDAASHLDSGGSNRVVPRRRVNVRPIEDLRCAWYLNMDVLDRPGVLGAVATAFGHHGVSIRSMEQVGLGDEARLIFLTHVAREGDVRATLEEIRQLEMVEHVGGVLRVAGDEGNE